LATDKLARAKLARAAAALNARSGSILPALVLMTDDERLPDPLAAARALPRGSMVILRARQKSHRAKLATELRRITRAAGNKLLIANDADLAARIGADGIHLSESDAAQAAHWRALHPRWIVTAAAHTARATCRPALDAVFLSPVFATQSHPESRSLGAMRLRCVAQMAPLPVYALGGIDSGTAGRLADAALIGLAAIGGLKPLQRTPDSVKSL
jgi:thiamine-phosphate pyrophosphorylase